MDKHNLRNAIIVAVIAAILSGVIAYFVNIKAANDSENAKKPFVSITSPKNSEKVGKKFRLEGHAKNIEVGQFLWLVREKSGRPNKFQPYENGIVIKPDLSFSMNFPSVPNHDGTETERLRKNHIVLIDANTRSEIIKYLENSKKNKKYPGMKFESKYEVLATIELGRLDD